MASRNARVNASRRRSTYRKPTGKKAGIWTVRSSNGKSCPTPTKRSYDSIGVAGLALRKIKENGGDATLHCYVCRCGKAHIGHNRYLKAA